MFCYCVLHFPQKDLKEQDKILTIFLIGTFFFNNHARNSNFYSACEPLDYYLPLLPLECQEINPVVELQTVVNYSNN